MIKIFFKQICLDSAQIHVKYFFKACSAFTMNLFHFFEKEPPALCSFFGQAGMFEK